MTRSIIRVLCAAAVLALIPAGAGHAQQKASLVFSAGPTGGSWTPMAAATAEVVKRKFPEVEILVEPGAALVNLEKMRNDKADIAWSMTTVVSDARTGAGSWKGKQTDKPMFVANYYPNVWQLVVPASADVDLVPPSNSDTSPKKLGGRITARTARSPVGAVRNTAIAPRFSTMSESLGSFSTNRS